MIDPSRIREVAQAGKENDPAWYRIHRRLSIHVTAGLLRTSVRLDHVTYTMMLMGLLAAVLLLSPSLWLNALGVLAGYTSFLLDKVDGEIARVRGQQSVRGILLDRFHHRLVEPLLFLAVGVRAWQVTGSATPVIAALATMLAANIIEETQQLPPFIAAKHASETRSWPESRRVPSPGVERLAAVMRALKTFRMYLTVLPLVLLAILAEAWTGRSVTTAYLLVSAAALWVYTLFQAWYYTHGNLDAEIASLERKLPPLPEPGDQPAEPSPSRVVAGSVEAERSTGTAQVAVIGALLLALVAGPALAANFYVDVNNPAASTAGPGTSTQPYSTINSAVAARGGAGNTILVRPGTYREQVSITASGVSGSRFIVKTTGNGAVVVDGSDDFSGTSKWVKQAGSVYLAAAVTWVPKQVIVNGTRLTSTSNTPATMPANTFRQVAGQGLYVNLGGGNPGSSPTFVGHRNYSFVISGASWVTVDGFQATRADDRGFYVSSNCADLEILNTSVSWACKYGIYASNSTRVRIAANKCFDNGHHGIMLTMGTSNCTVEDNEGYRNAVPGQRAANGLYLYGSTNNVIRRNKWHDNQDTGQHVQSGSNDNISYNNISWNNGDHGFDHLTATGTVHLNDVAYGNYKDGFSIEGSSTGTRLANCISIQNGLTTNEFDLWVDDASMVGFQSNDNIFWNATAQVPIKIGAAFYPQLVSYSAVTGQDTRSLQADPKFVSPSTGDFRLQGWSPAIDNGNSSDPNWPSQDREGNSRYDNPSVANTGLGPVKYSDRGAIEFRANGRVPTAALTATPSSGTAPLTVTLNASGSRDPDGSSLTYLFNFGDGTSAGPQSSANTTHVFAAGTYQPTVTVMDASGLTGSKSVTVTSNGHIDGAPVLNAPAASAAAENTLLTLGITATDPDGEAITSLTADLTGLPAGHTAVFTPGAGNTSGTLTWTPTFTQAGSYTVRFYATNAKSDTAITLITVANTDRAPVVTSPPAATFSAGVQGTVNVTAIDPDGDVITSLVANLAGLPSGNTAAFSAGPGNTTGVLTWTPTLAQAGTYSVYFTGTNALNGQDTTRITVLQSNQPPVASLVATPTSGTAPLTVTLNGSASSDPDGGTLSYTFEFGDGAVLGPQSPAQATHVYTAGTYTAKLTVTDPVGATSVATATITVSGSGLGPNLVTNGQFEVNLTGWSAYSSGTLARVAGGYEGAWAAQVTSTATTPGSFGFNDSPNWVVNAGALGTRYRFSAWVRSESARGTAKLQIREYLGSTKVGATTFSPTVTLSPTWQLLTVDHVSQGAGTTLDFQIYEIPLVLGETFLTDAVSIHMIMGSAQPVATNNPLDNQSLTGDALQFGARMVPTITSSVATLHFTTTRRGAVRVDLFDASGRRVKGLMDESDMAPGLHTLNVDSRSDRGDRLGAGVYFYRVQATERSAVGRLVFVR